MLIIFKTLYGMRLLPDVFHHVRIISMLCVQVECRWAHMPWSDISAKYENRFEQYECRKKQED